MSYKLEPMSESHRREVIDVFNYFISQSMAAYPDEPVGYGFFDRFLELMRGYPAFVVRENTGNVVGFGFLRPYHPAPTLRRTAEISYFILPGHTGKGLGSLLFRRLIEGAKAMGVENILAGISSRNEASLRFHRKLGFEECGRFRRVGRKFDQDFDILWMQFFIRPEEPAGGSHG